LGVRTQSLQSSTIVVGHFIQSPTCEGKAFYQANKKSLSHILMVATDRRQIGFEPTDQDSGKILFILRLHLEMVIQIVA